ncbi:MAG: cation transporter [Anaerococcus sp.]|nr:cation transporter [Anaerococcus sp.]MDU2354657.1 cation transporter [Anaerococcus sp.]
MRKLQDLKGQDENAKKREKQIVKTSIIGIVANALLAAFKAVIGLASNSIAIVLDAVNNIADAGSSLITIVGTKLAAKEPDKNIPLAMAG